MSTSAPCPTCRSTTATPVTFTWWGGIFGPKVLHHVKCETCGTAYNAKTGRSNTTAIVVYVVASFAIAAVILFAIAPM